MCETDWLMQCCSDDCDWEGRLSETVEGDCCPECNADTEPVHEWIDRVLEEDDVD